MAIVDDENAARQQIAENMARIERERVHTVDRIERMRRFTQDAEVADRREREEWRAFHECIYYLERENEVVIDLLATLHMCRPPAIVILPPGSLLSD
jgi:hypothetical protein